MFCTVRVDEAEHELSIELTHQLATIRQTQKPSSFITVHPFHGIRRLVVGVTKSSTLSTFDRWFVLFALGDTYSDADGGTYEKDGADGDGFDLLCFNHDLIRFWLMRDLSVLCIHCVLKGCRLMNDLSLYVIVVWVGLCFASCCARKGSEYDEYLTAENTKFAMGILCPLSDTFGVLCSFRWYPSRLTKIFINMTLTQ